MSTYATPPFLLMHGKERNLVPCHDLKSRRIAVRSVAFRVQAGVFTSGGHYEESILNAGDAGFAPMSSAHYFKNVGSTDSYVVLIFNAGQLTNIEATALVANMPAEVSQCSCSALFSYGLSRQKASQWQLIPPLVCGIVCRLPFSAVLDVPPL